MNKYTLSIAALTVSILATSAHAASISGQGTWETTLQARDLDGNLATAEAYYDTMLDITWLADANFGAGSTYDDIGLFSSSTTDGRMTWTSAKAWAMNLNPYDSGIIGWRLPEINPVNGLVYDYHVTYDGTTDVGFNISASGTEYAGSTGSEMSYMYHNTLGNLSLYDTSLNYQLGWGLSNTGPFSNLQDNGYFTATALGVNPSGLWYFNFEHGLQNYAGSQNDNYYAWAVHDGDVGLALPTSAVPVPAAAWLFASGLLGLIGFARKRRS